MKKTNPLIASFLILLFLNSCGTVAEGLGGSNKKGSDEFLVEKKAPLVLPPSFGELPEPGKKIDKEKASIKESAVSFKEKIDQDSSIDTNIENSELNNSIEKSIIEKINEKKIKEENLDETIEGVIITPKKKNFFQKIKEKFKKN